MKRLLIKRSFFGKIFLTTIFTFVGSIILISSISYYYNTKNSVQQIAKSYEKLLLQADYSIESLYQRTFEDGNRLFNDSDIIKALYADSIDPLDMQSINRKINDFVSTGKYTQSVYLYNGRNNRFIDTLKLQNLGVQEIDKDFFPIINSVKATPKSLLIPHQQKYTYNGIEYNKNIISMIFHYSEPSNDNVLFVNLKEEVLTDLFKSMDNSQHSIFIIIDKAGRIISNSEKPELFMSTIKEKPYVSKILGATKTSDYYVDFVDGKKELVNYIYNEKLEWFLISKTSYGNITKDIYNLQFSIIVITLLIVILGIAVFFAFIKRVYSPLEKVIKMLDLRGNISVIDKGSDEIEQMDRVFRSMISRITTMEDAATQNMVSLKEGYLKALLNNEINASDQKIMDKFKELDIKLMANNIRVIVFRIGKNDIMKFKSDIDLNFIKDAIFELICGTFDEKHNPTMVNMGLNTIICILNIESIKSLISEISEIIKNIDKLMTISLKAGISDCVENINDIDKCYDQAKEALEYSFVFPDYNVFDYSEIQKRTNKNFTYPIRLENSLIESLRIHDIAKCKSLVNQIFNELQDYAYSDIDLSVKQLAATIEKEMGRNVDFGMFYSRYKSNKIINVISKIEYYEDVKNFFIDLCGFIVQQLKDNVTKGSNDLIRKACEYINENYSDPNMSAVMIASMLNISVPYFSKLFSEIMKTNYSNYICEIRMNKAAALLNENKLNVNEISQKVGILNSSYFITLFKKKYGVSPNQYRQKDDL